jgi:type IV pilus assembly protein PilW
VVARSKAAENVAAGSNCSATTALPVVFAGKVPQDVAAAPVTVNVAVANDPVNWRCYRYRVFETVVNLRNAGWRPPLNASE